MLLQPTRRLPIVSAGTGNNDLHHGNLSVGEKNIHQPLLTKESTMHTGPPPVGTITFYQGDMEAASLFLQARISDVLALNPWLGGRLGRAGNNNLELVYPPKPIPLDLDNVFTVLPDPIKNIHVKTQYELLVKACIPLFIGSYGQGNGLEQLKAQSIVSRFVIVPTFSTDSDQPGFALVFSMSHVVGDAFTYHQILGMLSDDPRASVRALNPVRKHEFEKDYLRRLVGPESLEFLFSSAFSDAKLAGIMRNQPTTPLAFLLDEVKVDYAKETHAIANGSYISTNDIITSHFMNVCKPRLGLMSMNFRSRCPILDSEDAGNYQGFVLFDADGYPTPGAVRGAMSPDCNGAYSGITKNLPKCGKDCKLAVVTSWVMKGAGPSFDLSLDGKIQQLLHLPLEAIPLPTSFLDFAIVFRPIPTKLAVLVFAKGLESETMMAGNHPFGGCVNLDMFPHCGTHQA